MTFSYFRRHVLLFSLVILSGLIISAVSSIFLFRYTREQTQIRIERQFEISAEQLQLSINNTLNTLTSVAGLFYSSNDVSQKQFKKFVSVNLQDKNSIISLAWVPQIKHEQRKMFEENMSGRGMHGKHIYDFNSHGLESIAIRTDVYYPVQFLYSRIDTLLFPGLNLGTQYKTRKKFEEAANAKKSLVTKSFRLQRGKPGLLTVRAFKPVYQDQTQSSDQLKGFVLAQIDVEDLMTSTFSEEDMLSIILFDVDADIDNQLLYLNKVAAEKYSHIVNINQLGKLEHPYWTHYYNVGDRKWLVSFIENIESNSLILWLPYLGLLVGLFFTAYLTLYMLIAWNKTREVIQLKKESEAKSRFLQAIGHDLRQPLNVIGLYLTRYEQDDNIELTPENIKLIKNIRESIKGLHNMFTSLLDITRLEAGMTQPQFERVPLSPLLTDLGDEFDLLAAEKNLEFKMRCQDITIKTDPVLLERVLRNLLNNAVKYTDQGRLFLGARKVSHQVKIYIMDTGRGFNNNEREKILEPYQRGERTGDIDGLGLGLAIVQQTLDILNLSMEINSETDKGTVIILSL